MSYEKFQHFSAAALENQRERMMLRQKRRALSEQEQEELAAIESALSTKTKVVRVSTHGILNATQAVPERSEGEKVDAVLFDAMHRGLVDIRDIKVPSSKKQCVIIGSGHLPHEDQDVRLTPETTFRAQHQLFCLLHLLKHAEVRSTLYVEGGRRGEPTHFQSNIVFPDGQAVPLQSDEVQRFFLQHPAEFRLYQEQIHRERMGGAFFALSAYEHIEGAHCPDVMDSVNRAYDMVKIERRFWDKYRENLPGDVQMQGRMLEGRWWIFINQHWVTPEELMQDSAEYLQFFDAVNACSLKREREVVDLFSQADESRMPLAWVGLAHVDPIVEACASRGMSSRIVTPTAERSINGKMGGEEIAKQLYEYARNHTEANAKLDAQ